MFLNKRTTNFSIFQLIISSIQLWQENRSKSFVDVDDFMNEDDELAKIKEKEAKQLLEHSISMSTELLKSKLKNSLAKGENISSIEKIFEHVVNESMKVNESLKQISLDDSNNNPKK